MSNLTAVDFLSTFSDHFHKSDLVEFNARRVNDINGKFPFNAVTSRFLRTHAFYDHQRAIKPDWANHLTSEILAGEFLPNVTPVILGLVGDKLYLIGGNQRLTAIVAANQYKSIEYVMDLKIIRFSDEDAMFAWYKKTHEALALTAGQRNSVNIQERKGLTDSELNAVVSAVREIIIEKMDPGMGWTIYEAKSNDVYKAVEHYLDSAVEVIKLIKSGVDTKKYWQNVKVAPRLGMLITLFKYFNTKKQARQLILDTYQGNANVRSPAHWWFKTTMDEGTYGSGGQNGRTMEYREAAAIWNFYYKNPRSEFAQRGLNAAIKDNNGVLLGVPQDIPVNYANQDDINGQKGDLLKLLRNLSKEIESAEDAKTTAYRQAAE